MSTAPMTQAIALLRGRIGHSYGRAGSDWCNQLPGLVADLMSLWTDQPQTLLHGDLQGSNILQSPHDGWAVIDPLGMIGETALEALTVLRDRWATLPTSPSPKAALLRRLHAFADAACTPTPRVIAWTHARSVRAVLAGITDDHDMHAWVASQLEPGRVH